MRYEHNLAHSARTSVRQENAYKPTPGDIIGKGYNERKFHIACRKKDHKLDDLDVSIQFVTLLRRFT